MWQISFCQENKKIKLTETRKENKLVITWPKYIQPNFESMEDK